MKRVRYRAIDYMIQSLGAERVMWASDFPGIRKEMSLKALWSYARLAVDGEEVRV